MFPDFILCTGGRGSSDWNEGILKMTLTSVIPRRIYDCRAMHCGKVDLSAVDCYGNVGKN